MRGEIAWLILLGLVLIIEYLAPEDQLLTDAAHRYPRTTAVLVTALAYHLTLSGRGGRLNKYDPLRPIAWVSRRLGSIK